MPKKTDELTSQYWGFLTYEDSNPHDCVMDYLKQSGIRFCRSPIHDKDIKEDGSLKEPHYHWMICFPGYRTLSSALKTVAPFGLNYLEAIMSPRDTWDYYDHHGYPDKAQYNPDDRFSNFDTDELPGYNKASKKKQETVSLTKELLSIIKTNQVHEFCKLADLLLDYGRDDLLDLFMSKTYFFDRYLTSTRFNRQSKAELELMAERKKSDEYLAKIAAAQREVCNFKLQLAQILDQIGENPSDRLSSYEDPTYS